MGLRLWTWAERPELADRGVPSGEIWPEYNNHGDVFDRWWLPMLDELPEYQFALCDEADAVLAEGHTAPLQWDGDDATLPAGIDDALERAVAGHRAERPADTLSAMAAEVLPSARHGGLSGEVLGGMREIARRRGLRDDGALLDPWMRLHERLGAPVATPLPRSMLISGTVAEWEAWTGLPLPASGEYTFPHGLAPVRVDREANRAAYWEPNVWMVHPDVV